MRNHIPESRGNAGMWKSLHDSHIPTPLQVSFIPHRTSERSPYLVPLVLASSRLIFRLEYAVTPVCVTASSPLTV